MLPWMIGERGVVVRCNAITCEKFDQLPALLVREAGADANVLQGAVIVEKPEQQRADRGALAFLVPANPGDHAVAIALVFHLEHHTFVRLVGP